MPVPKSPGDWLPRHQPPTPKAPHPPQDRGCLYPKAPGGLARDTSHPAAKRPTCPGSRVPVPKSPGDWLLRPATAAKAPHLPQDRGCLYLKKPRDYPATPTTHAAKAPQPPRIAGACTPQKPSKRLRVFHEQKTGYTGFVPCMTNSDKTVAPATRSNRKALQNRCQISCFMIPYPKQRGSCNPTMQGELS